MIAEFSLKDNFGFFDAQIVAKFCLDRFLSGKVNRITAVYSDFINTLTQVPTRKQMVPLRSFDVGNA